MNANIWKEIANLPAGKSIYFASDFHLGAYDKKTEKAREEKIIRWLENITPSAHAVILLGDIFDFWFEYKHVVPRGFIRFQGKLAEMIDQGIHIVIFTGNHDMWMFEYFTDEMNIRIERKPISVVLAEHKFYLGHGDGLGPRDRFYKFLKKIFNDKFFQWLFALLHPGIGMSVAQYWSYKSKQRKNGETDPFQGEREWLLQYCKEVEQITHHDYYVFGHRHLAIEMEVAPGSRYVNVGEWISTNSFAIFDGKKLSIQAFENKIEINH